jgi:polyisoprenoid-binding protein YceI
MNYRQRACALTLAIAILLVARPVSAKILHLEVDTSATHIVATVDEPFPRLQGNVSGSFRLIKGDVEGDPADPAGTGHVEILINPTTYDSENSHRDFVVLRDALETRIYSIIKFKSTRIEDFKWDAPGAIASATIVGNLTLHGVTREVRVPVSATLSPDGQFSADGNFQIDCTDFGITPPRSVFGLLRTGKIVDLDFRITAASPIAPARP